MGRRSNTSPSTDETATTTKRLSLTLNRIAPITSNQVSAFEAFNDHDMHLLLHGLPGTGKTFIALYLALNATMVRQFFQKVVIVRSVVPSRQIGYLPGDEKRKASVYEAPYVDACSKLFSRGDAYTYLKNRGVIEFITTSFIRGTTIDNAVVIIDEVQNMAEMELHSIITRLGENCRMIMSGDIGQDDLTSSRYNEFSGLVKMMKILDRMRCVHRVEFDVGDIVRSNFVRDYIIAKQAVEEKQHLTLVRS